MKQLTFFILFWLLTASCGTFMHPLAASVPASCEPQDTNNATDTWIEENYNLVVALAFQESCTGRIKSSSMRWIVCVRIIPAYPSELESAVSVERSYDGTILARVARPWMQSIRMQLHGLKQDHPTATAGDLAKLIVLETKEGDQQKFPTLRRLVDDFEKIRFSPALSDELMMDATKYIFHSKSFSGEQLDLALQGPGPSAPHQPHPMLEWVEALRRALGGSFK